MRNFFKRVLRPMFIFLAVLGPSVIGTMAGNDGAGVITYSFAGAQLGYVALLTLPLLTVFYAVTQEMGSRIAIVTGKGLGDIIRERFGIRVAFFVFTTLIIANFGTIVTDVAALKTASLMLGIPSIPFIIATIVFCFLLITRTEYEKSQKIFITGMIFYCAYVFSAFKGNPNWGEALKGMFIPDQRMFSKDFLLISIAILGTTITPWGQFFVQSYMKDKNVPIGRLKYAQLEAYLGAFLSNFFTFFIIVATAATLYVHKVTLNSGETAATAIKPFAGDFAGVLFAIGLVNAAIIGIVIVSLTSAYAFSEFFGFAGSLDNPYKKEKAFYLNFLISMILAAILVITPWFPLFKIVIFTQSLNGVLLPVFFYYLLKIVNDKELMGQHINGKRYNWFSIGCTVFIGFAAIAAMLIQFIG
mgnify:FL=1